MKVVHFCHSFSPLSETFIYNYIMGLEEHNIENYILTLQRVNKSDRPFDNSKEEVVTLKFWNIFRIWSIIRDHISGKNTETSSWPEYRKKLKKKLARLNPDIVHAHFGPMGVLINPVCKALKIPLFVTYYGYDISQYAGDEFWVNHYQNLAETVGGVTVLSSMMKEEILDVGFQDDKVHVVHLGVNLDQFSYSPPPESLREFLSVGRLSDKKGHLDTIKSFKKVLEREDRHLKLKIVGEGPDRVLLQKYIKDQKLEEYIELKGSLTHSEVAKEMKKADAFILCSKTAASGDREGTPTVLIEAMASGLPCISTFHSGIPEIFPEQNHIFLAQEADVESIAYCIEKLLSCSKDELKKVSKAGRQRIEESFNVMKETQKLKTLYYEFLKHH